MRRLRASTSLILALALPAPAASSPTFVSEAVTEQARAHTQGTVDVIVTYRGRPGTFERNRAVSAGAQVQGGFELVPSLTLRVPVRSLARLAADP